MTFAVFDVPPLTIWIKCSFKYLFQSKISTWSLFDIVICYFFLKLYQTFLFDNFQRTLYVIFLLFSPNNSAGHFIWHFYSHYSNLFVKRLRRCLFHTTIFHPLRKQEAQLSPRDRAMRRVNWNLANCHATVQKLLIRQVLTKSMVWRWGFSRRQCVIDNVHSTMTRSSRLPLSQVS